MGFKLASIYIAALGLLIAPSLWAASTYVDPFDSTPKPRSLAMGNTGVAYGNDIHGVFYNPATVAGIKSIQFMASSGATLQDVNNTTEVIAFPMGNSQTSFAVGYSAFQVNNILNANYVGGIPTIVGAASFSNSVVFVSGATRTGFGQFGILAKSFNNGLDVQGSGTGFAGQGMNLDAGALWSLNSNTRVGIAFKNMLGNQSIRYSNGVTDALAQKTLVGIGTQFKNDKGNYLGLAIDYEYVSNAPGYSLWHGGVEWGFDRNIALRAGVNQVRQSQQDIRIVSQMTLGVGVHWEGLYFDYAYYPDFGEMGDTKHFFGIAYLGVFDEETPLVQETKKPVTPVATPVITGVETQKDYSVKIEPKKQKDDTALATEDQNTIYLEDQRQP